MPLAPQRRMEVARTAERRNALNTDITGVRPEPGLGVDEVEALIDDHEAAADPHPQYTTAAELAAAAYTDEMAQDAVAAALAAGTHTGITVTYTDGSDKIDLTVTIGGPTGIRKAASTTRNNNTLSDDPHLTVALAATTAYYIRAVLHYSIANATMDFKYRFNYTGTLTSHMATRIGAVAGAAGGTDNQGTVSDAASINADVSVLGTTSGVGVLIAEFAILTNTAGTFSVQWAQNTTDAGNCIMQAGSSLTVIQ